MIENNYFTENEDLQLMFNEIIDWSEVVEGYEQGFGDAKKYAESQDERFAFAPNNQEEAMEYYRSVLDSLGEFMGRKVAPRAAEMDQTGLKYADGKVTFPDAQNELYSQAKETGLMPYGLSRRYGGLGLPSTIQGVIGEISARADAAFCLAFGSLNVIEIVERYGSDEMRDEWLPKFAAADYTCAMALTEPNHGSNLPGVQTKAVKDADGNWRITGAKRFITHASGYINAPCMILTLARTGAPESGARGLSFFLVDAKDVEVAGIEHKMGLHCSPTCEVVYDNAPAKMIGKEGHGLIKYSMGMMNTARLLIAAQSLGIAQAAREEAVKYAGEREQFGKLIQEIPAVRRILDEMDRELIAMRALMFEAGRTVDLYLWKKHHMLEDGKSEREVRADEGVRTWEKLADLFTPLAKYYLSEMSVKIASDAIQVFGGSGYTEEYDVARIYRDSRITTIYEGTTQLQIVACIGGVVAGMSQAGALRQYVTREMERFSPSADLSRTWDLLNDAVTAYKRLEGETRDSLAFETVECAARFIMGMILERGNGRLSGAAREKREKITTDFHVDSLAVMEGNLVKLARAASPAPVPA